MLQVQSSAARKLVKGEGENILGYFVVIKQSAFNFLSSL